MHLLTPRIVAILSYRRFAERRVRVLLLSSSTIIIYAGPHGSVVASPICVIQPCGLEWRTHSRADAVYSTVTVVPRISHYLRFIFKPTARCVLEWFVPDANRHSHARPKLWRLFSVLPVRHGGSIVLNAANLSSLVLCKSFHWSCVARYSPFHRS